MSKETRTPKTLLEVVTLFSDETVAFKAAAYRRWPNGVVCPMCGSSNVRLMEKRRAWNCNGCRKQFTAKTGTIFEDSPLGFSKWLPAMWLLANAKNGISSCELARALGVTQKTAWFMNHRLRLAMETGSFVKLTGEVEADETFIGPKRKNLHKDKKHKRGLGGQVGMSTVFGMMERGGRVVTIVVENNGPSILKWHILRHVDRSASLFTDQHHAYSHMDAEYTRYVVNHDFEWARGNVHTNNLECYWSLLKRTLRGTYVAVDPWHLYRYCEEQAFRFNVRRMSDGERFETLAQQTLGKRLTYRELTGKEYLPVQ